jgi:hypothetical protein
MARTGWLLGFAAAGLVGCATLPEYAAPQGKLVTPDTLDTTDVIPYRTLTRADFKGANPPAEFAPYADMVGAATCAYILTTPDTRVFFQPFRAPDGAIRYRATFENLRFFAQMDRNCSWWNPKERRVGPEYVLEHEQIHFAIFELESRRLNASAPELAARLQATATDADSAVRLVQQQLEAHLAGEVKKILERSRRFDEDTSLGTDPKKQKEWRDLVLSELAASAP